jgi:hypothetical protein
MFRDGLRNVCNHLPDDHTVSDALTAVKAKFAYSGESQPTFPKDLSPPSSVYDYIKLSFAMFLRKIS